MIIFRNLLRGLRSLASKEKHSLEIEEELRGFMEEAAQGHLRNGMSEDEAMHAARVEMGSVESVKQQIRASHWESTAESVWQDVCYGVRQLIRSPNFTLVTVLTLALGIGANTAIFTLVHGLMMKTLPVAHPEQLYRVGSGDLCCAWGGLQDSWGLFDYPFYQKLMNEPSGMDELAAFSAGSNSKTVRRADSSAVPQTLSSIYVSGNYFSTLGVQPMTGRLLNPGDDLPESPAVAVMGYDFWQNYFASDPSIVGSKLTINGLPVTLVGITPPGFFGAKLAADPAELWIPLHQQPAFEGQGQKSLLYSSGMTWLMLMGRLKPGVSAAQVEARTTAQLQQYLRDNREMSQEDLVKLPRQKVLITPGGTGISDLRSTSKTGLILLSAASFLVLLVACANIANLLLTRAAARYQQTALRLCLGATRARLMRAVLTESLLLSTAGGATGLLLAYGTCKAILLVAFRGAVYIPISATPSLPVFVFALLISIVTGILFGVAPAWIGAHAAPADGLGGSGRSTQGRTSPLHKSMVVVQTALSIVLLAMAGLTAQSLRNLEGEDMGFTPEGRLLATINPSGAGYKVEQLPALYRALEDRLGNIPGVRSASFSLHSPQNGCCINVGIMIGGRPESWIGNIDTALHRVSTRYFETVGIPIVLGRPILDQDTASSQHVAVVDQNFARTFFGTESPLGKHFGISLTGHAFDYEIVGVARDALNRRPGAKKEPAYYLPFTQATRYDVEGYQRLEDDTRFPRAIELNVSGRPEEYVNILRSTLAGINPELSAFDIKTYTEQVAIQFNQERLVARITGLFSVVALLLASIGLYGVTAYNVTRRTSEIGIRMALGANRSDVVWMVLRTALSQVVVGFCVGIPIAYVCGHYLTHVLYNVGHSNPLMLAGATITLSAFTLVASFLPARRAASIQPVQALRSE
jgi:predicted permease